MTHQQQQQYDKLVPLIGGEESTRDQLTTIDTEIEAATSALTPLLTKRTELVAKLNEIERAKVEAAALKQLTDTSK